MTARAYDDIPGTVVFDARQSRKGYHLNMFCMSLMSPANRAAFKAGEAAYLTKFTMTDEQRDAVLKRDWTRMLELGGNVFCMVKLAVFDGTPFQHVNAIMTGMSITEYEDMMNAGGRPMAGNRSKKELHIG